MELPTFEEARRKFPIGTIFSNKNLGLMCDNIEVTGTHYYISCNCILIDKDSNKCKGYSPGAYTVYQDGVWAEITNPNIQGINYEIY